ncbi:hypothetical protein [Microcella sp.]|uniref:hypothetical protein n=1 Tax=Microcella sp. TaxID=1913979 RepID=UPI00391DE474
MSETDLIRQWNTTRWHIIVSQIAPTLLLAFTVWMLVDGLAETSLAVRLAATGILLASGILGAAAQYAAATEGAGVVDGLRQLEAPSAVATRIVAMGWGVNVVRFVTPAVFIVVFVALVLALFAGL